MYPGTLMSATYRWLAWCESWMVSWALLVNLTLKEVIQLINGAWSLKSLELFLPRWRNSYRIFALWHIYSALPAYDNHVRPKIEDIQ